MKFVLGLLVMSAILASTASAQEAKSVPVTADNFIRAESDLYASNLVKEGGFGKFFHIRTPTPIDHQMVIRMNRDTLYSGAVFDLDAGPVTITMPDAGKRFMSLQVISEDHYTPLVVYKGGPVTLTRDLAGTRYVVIGIRTLVDPVNSKDVQAVHELQDAIKVEQAGGPGKFEVPNWDLESQKKVRDALAVLGSTLGTFNKAFGKKGEVDPVRRLIGAAVGWGGNPDADATYLNFTPTYNDGKKTATLIVKDVPVDGFWSISVYNAKGYFEKNAQDAYTVNNLTAKKKSDGSVAIQFGGSSNDPDVNVLPITPGWNYTVRLYRPRAEILSGSWKFPEATEMR